jgi:hypothetical protein
MRKKNKLAYCGMHLRHIPKPNLNYEHEEEKQVSLLWNAT